MPSKTLARAHTHTHTQVPENRGSAAGAHVCYRRRCETAHECDGEGTKGGGVRQERRRRVTPFFLPARARARPSRLPRRIRAADALRAALRRARAAPSTCGPSSRARPRVRLGARPLLQRAAATATPAVTAPLPGAPARARGARRVPAGEQGREGARRRKRFFAAGAGARAGSTAIGVAAACTWRHRAPIPRRAAVAAPRASSIYKDLLGNFNFVGKFNFSFTATLITAPFTTGMHPLQDAEGQEKKL